MRPDVYARVGACTVYAEDLGTPGKSRKTFFLARVHAAHFFIAAAVLISHAAARPWWFGDGTHRTRASIVAQGDFCPE